MAATIETGVWSRHTMITEHAHQSKERMNVDNRSKLITLHRYFIWADKMRRDFYNILANKANVEKKTFDIYAFLYMSYWYAGLYVVIEGWRKLSLKSGAIDSLLISQNVSLLKRYRNGVFHFQEKYYDDRFIEFMNQGKDCVSWVRQLNEAFSDYFLGEFPPPPGALLE